MSATKPTDDDHDETAAPADAPVATDDKPAEADDRAASNGADAEAGADADAGADAKAGADADAGADAKAGAGETSSAEDDDAEAKDNLLARGNPLRWKRGLVAILGGGFPAFLLMAKNGQNGWALPLGLLFVCVAVFGVMDLLGTFDDGESGSAGGEAEVESSTSLRALAPSLGAVVALTIAFGAILSLAQSAVLSPWLAAVLVPGSFIGLVAAVFAAGKQLGPWRTDEVGVERPLTSRHGFWVVVIGALLYLPLLGMFSLWDPWETHYGEVAREILSRDDWISLWWAQDGWFWSKPILNFWIQSLAMGSLGTHYQPDQMMIAADGTAAAHAEWVVRTPNVLMTIGAMYLLYKGVAKVFGRRAGLLGAIVLATMPDWFFLAHQTMTDMPFVAAMTAAMGLLLFGLNTDEDARVRLYEVDAFGAKLRFSLWHLVFGAVLLCAVPQILYLLSRNVELVVFGEGPKGFHFHWDEFRSGSAGNCDLPGNEKCASHSPASLPKTDNWWHGSKASSALAFMRFFAAFEPGFQAIAWAAVLGGALYLNWGERRARRLVYIAAWLCAAIATMAKGPAGFGLPIICAIAYVATKKRWSELLRFELISGLLIILAVALPWYVAMYVRHGSPFTDRLIFHDMFNRAFSHVHDTNEGDDTGIRYYVWQLGYAAFPWTGLVPLGLLWGFRRSDSALARVFAPRATSTPGADGAAATPAGAAVGDASVMLVMWFLFAFALFTFMGTKFHHYIFPAVPPAAMLVGVVLDDMLGRATTWAKPTQRAVYLGCLALAAGIATVGASKLWPGSPFGAKPDAGASGSVTVAVVMVAIGVALFVVAALMFKGSEAEPTVIVQDPGRSPFRGGLATRSDDAADESVGTKRGHLHEQLMLGAAALAGAMATVLVGRDLAMKAEGSDATGGIRLLQLFTYNYRRPWPDTLDFSAILGGFTVVAGLLGLALAARSLRRHAVAAVCGFGLLWAVWGLDVYMMALSPHWGQHEVIEAYYRDRKGPEEMIVAYQMNWKGENFYTGNRIPAFVSTGANFQTWLKKERDKGTKVLYFVTEHSRTSGLRSEVAAKSYKEITDKALCNKFILVRAEL
ncbi:MAG: glycosyltransferase family 39 protein [Labilithrix sp.]|nr:glycosyltransferase family 39 protein [Labilithrix sp.]